nr:MAG TPA: hypothetical protein [Caudoviricetes sp.]
MVHNSLKTPFKMHKKKYNNTSSGILSFCYRVAHSC